MPAVKIQFAGELETLFQPQPQLFLNSWQGFKKSSKAFINNKLPVKHCWIGVALFVFIFDDSFCSFGVAMTHAEKLEVSAHTHEQKKKVQTGFKIQSC